MNETTFLPGDTVHLRVDFATSVTYAPVGTICTVRRILYDLSGNVNFISVVGPDRHIWLAKPYELEKVTPPHRAGSGQAGRSPGAQDTPVG